MSENLTHLTLRKRLTKESVETALRETKGMISLAAKRLGCSRETVYDYIKKYPSVATAIHDEREATLDMAELALFKAIQNGEAWAIAMTLKTIGKQRGYVERQEVTGADGGGITIKVSYGDD